MSVFEQSLVEQVARLKQRANASHSQLRRTFDTLTAFVWNNPDGYTPQDVLAQIGTDALKLFTLSAMTAQLLAEAEDADVQQVVPEGWEYEFQPDGSITITGTPSSSSESSESSELSASVEWTEEESAAGSE